MKPQPTPTSEKTFACETCPMRKKAKANPKTLMARLWRRLEGLPGTPG